MVYIAITLPGFCRYCIHFTMDAIAPRCHRHDIHIVYVILRRSFWRCQPFLYRDKAITFCNKCSRSLTVIEYGWQFHLHGHCGRHTKYFDVKNNPKPSQTIYVIRQSEHVIFFPAPIYMGKPRAWAVSSSEINITWVQPDPVSEIRGDVKMYQVIWVKKNTDTEYNMPPKENVVWIFWDSFHICCRRLLNFGEIHLNSLEDERQWCFVGFVLHRAEETGISRQKSRSVCRLHLLYQSL